MFQAAKVVLRLVKSFSGPPEPWSRYDGPGPAAPESGSWTCSGDQASVTFIKADGPNTWDIQRDAP